MVHGVYTSAARPQTERTVHKPLTMSEREALALSYLIVNSRTAEAKAMKGGLEDPQSQKVKKKKRTLEEVGALCRVLPLSPPFSAWHLTYATPFSCPRN